MDRIDLEPVEPRCEQPSGELQAVIPTGIVADRIQTTSLPGSEFLEMVKTTGSIRRARQAVRNSVEGAQAVLLGVMVRKD